MSDIERRPSRSPRRVREQRAYRLVQVGGVAGAVAVVGLVLTLVTAFPWGIWFTAAVIAAVCAILFWRTVSK